MRTKTLLLTAALAAAGAATSMAQSTIYSVNAVGYINKTIHLNAQLVAAPFEVSDYSLTALLPPDQVKNNCVVYKPVGNTFQVAFFAPSDGFWDGDPITIDPGNGVILVSDPAGSMPAPFNVTMVGQVKQSVGNAPIVTPVPAGASIKSSQVSQAGGITSVLGFTPTANVRADFYNPSGTAFEPAVFYSVADGFWDDHEPTLGYAEGIFLTSDANQNWSRVFNVN
jgi:hypothetical protein